MLRRCGPKAYGLRTSNQYLHQCFGRVQITHPKSFFLGLGGASVQTCILQHQPWVAHRAISTQSSAGEGIVRTLEERGLINQIVGERAQLQKLLNHGKNVGVYIGVDPTAASMHLGNLVPMMALYWLYALGCRAFCLTGGATAMIGDPSGRTSARASQAASTREENATRISKQLESLFTNVDQSIERHMSEEQGLRHKTMLDNIQWFEKTQALDLLSTLAAGMRMGPLLGRDSVKQRMAKSDSMSLAEFVYPMLQAWDWWHLYQHHSVQLQIGGSDQFGNILAGADGVNYMRKQEQKRGAVSSADDATSIPIGFTVPLLTTSSGEKFGKSAGNAIWLDADMTSPFHLYQFFLRTADSDLERYLKLFTFLPVARITDTLHHHFLNPPQRLAQHALAKEVTALVHGLQIAESTEQEHRRLFQRSNQSGSASDLLGSLTASSPTKILPRLTLQDLTVSKLIHRLDLAPSLTSARTTVKGGGVYAGQISDAASGGLVFQTIGVTKEQSTSPGEASVDWQSFIIDSDKLIIRKGKTGVCVVKLVNDQEYEKFEEEESAKQ